LENFEVVCLVWVSEKLKMNDKNPGLISVLSLIHSVKKYFPGNF
jgi:hypothetical protein